MPDLPAGPVADKLSIWPLELSGYGLDATFQGATGYSRMEQHQAALRRSGLKFSLRQELDGGWTLRFGPLTAVDVGKALSAFLD